MPWTETNVMDQRTEFVMRAVSGGENFSELCRQFGISRKVGYKWKERFIEEGLAGLKDQSRRPQHHPHELSEAMVCEIVKLKLAHPRWGPRKLRAVLEKRIGSRELPSESSFKRVLDKAGLVERRRRTRPAQATRLTTPAKAERPNHVWTIDFKGWWYTRDRTRFEPLTIRDDFSRYVLCARALDDARSDSVRTAMSGVFRRFGLPEVLRSDNGPPFAANNSPLGLSRLSAWWITLGIDLDRIPPGRPDQNGGHERMHRDVAEEVQVSGSDDRPTQQVVLDQWRTTFNEKRPHEALQMRVPKDVYEASPRKFDPRPTELAYPSGYLVRKINGGGELKVSNRRISVSTALAGLEVGLEPLPNNRFATWLCRLRLGELDLESESFHATERG